MRRDDEQQHLRRRNTEPRVRRATDFNVEFVNFGEEGFDAILASMVMQEHEFNLWTTTRFTRVKVPMKFAVGCCSWTQPLLRHHGRAAK